MMMMMTDRRWIYFLTQCCLFNFSTTGLGKKIHNTNSFTDKRTLPLCFLPTFNMHHQGKLCWFCVLPFHLTLSHTFERSPYLYFWSSVTPCPFSISLYVACLLMTKGKKECKEGRKTLPTCALPMRVIIIKASFKGDYTEPNSATPIGLLFYLFFILL